MPSHVSSHWVLSVFPSLLKTKFNSSQETAPLPLPFLKKSLEPLNMVEDGRCQHQLEMGEQKGLRVNIGAQTGEKGIHRDRKV